ncbi:PQQ-dependent sugar dehydrogenase [soil metagenome]
MRTMMHHPLIALLATAALAAGCASADDPDTDSAAIDAVQRPPADCTPLQTADRNAPDQTPAFPVQTRACELTANVAFGVDVVATGLEHPWAVEPLPDGDLLVTERPGRMRIVSMSCDVGQPIAGVPPVSAQGQGGLLDVALSPSFASDRTIFWSYAEPRDGGNGTSVARGVLSADRASLQDVRVIFRAAPTYDGRLHFGSRLAFDAAGMLFITTGERSDREMRMHSQRLDNHLGKIMRIRPDGSVPGDNPFVGQAGAMPEVWSYGHRNTQALAFDPAGRLWGIEHCARGGDELNLIESGANYGWPVGADGIEYSGAPIETAEPQRPAGDFTPPVYYWDPVIAPSGAQFYTGDAFPAWRGSLFIGALRDQRLVRLTLDGGRVIGEEHLITDRGARVRDVRQGPDGALYIVTDEDDGEIWRVRPAG